MGCDYLTCVATRVVYKPAPGIPAPPPRSSEGCVEPEEYTEAPGTASLDDQGERKRHWFVRYPADADYDSDFDEPPIAEKWAREDGEMRTHVKGTLRTLFDREAGGWLCASSGRERVLALCEASGVAEGQLLRVTRFVRAEVAR